MGDNDKRIVSTDFTEADVTEMLRRCGDASTWDDCLTWVINASLKTVVPEFRSSEPLSAQKNGKFSSRMRYYMDQNVSNEITGEIGFFYGCVNYALSPLPLIHSPP